MEKKFNSVKNQTRYKNLNINALNIKDDNLLFRDLKNTSLGFDTGAVEKTFGFFENLFGLNNYKYFKEKFLESISGDGDELSKINALHSSSLCALLCFFNIKNKPITYRDITYNDVYFEVKNKVVRNPSNMDVVLIGKDKEGKSAILFIECKYSEFLDNGAYKLSDTYRKDPYKKIFDGFHYDEKKVFQYGLKQLVTHYIGIKNFIEGTKTNDDSYKNAMAKYYRSDDERLDERLNVYKHFDIVSFIEVIYDFEGEDNYNEYLRETKEVFDTLEETKKIDNISLNLLGTMTYKDFFNGQNNNVLPPLVRDFYNLKK